LPLVMLRRPAVFSLRAEFTITAVKLLYPRESTNAPEKATLLNAQGALDEMAGALYRNGLKARSEWLMKVLGEAQLPSVKLWVRSQQ